MVGGAHLGICRNIFQASRVARDVLSIGNPVYQRLLIGLCPSVELLA